MSGVTPLFTARFIALQLILLFFAVVLVWRVVDLTVIHREFLQKQGVIRSERILLTPAYRGMITDRNGEPLAVSIPVDAVWVNPKDFVISKKQLHELARLLEMPSKQIQAKLKGAQNKGFIYLKRGLPTTHSQAIKALKVPGLYLQREFRRTYPEGAVAAHLLGFTNVDDQGVEGMELAYDDWLKGRVGKQRVIKDRLGHIIDSVETIQEPSPGHNVRLSIDRRIQYLAFRALKDAVKEHQAESGSIVILDTKNGEVLAIVNSPSFDPNDRNKRHTSRFRNRAVTDVFEPGSAMKAFSIVEALKSGQFNPNTKINTATGIEIGHHFFHDEHYHEEMTLTEVLQYSSNVGISKMILALTKPKLVELLQQVGFGTKTESAFPGESSGFLTHKSNLSPLELATLAFGYGLNVTPLQLAHAYSAFANGGLLYPVSLIHTEKSPTGKEVIDPKIAQQMLTMLEAVVEEHQGTGKGARVNGFRVAGKTATSRIVGQKGYEKDHHIATFVGIAPVSHPRIVIVVVIRDPLKGGYYGGDVAAPVFSEVLQGTLSVLQVVPDFAARTPV